MAQHFMHPELTPEHERYGKAVAELSATAFGPDWQNQWADHVEEWRPIGWLSQLGPFGSLDKLMERTEEGLTGRPAVCFIENITLPWATKLGSEWHVDPNFFISHISPLSGEDLESLQEARPPNANGKLKSIRSDSGWVTIRGHADYGRPKGPLPEAGLPNSTKRQHELSALDSRIAHTNLSICRIEEGLREFTVPQRRSRRSQTDILPRN